MGILSNLGFGGSSSSSESGLKSLFPISMLELDFVRIDIKTIYKRILTDVLERTENIPEDKKKLLWDNCLADESSEGLVSLVAKAMFEKTKLFLVYDEAIELIRKADAKEQAEIEKAYKTGGDKPPGVLYVNFSKFELSDILKVYSVLEYCTVASLHKSMNLSKALQLKMSELRSSTGNIDSAEVVAQAKSIAEALGLGQDVLTDAKDIIETSKPDLTATAASMEFIAQKRSFYLGYPASYITGIANKGLSDTGNGDAKATERGHRGFYFSIVKPIVEAIFNVETSFKSEDVDQTSSGLEMLKTFELTSDELVSRENKQKLVNKKFSLPEDAKGDEPVVTDPVIDPNKPAPKPGDKPDPKAQVPPKKAF